MMKKKEISCMNLPAQVYMILLKKIHLIPSLILILKITLSLSSRDKVDDSESEDASDEDFNSETREIEEEEIHLNQILQKIESDLVSAKSLPLFVNIISLILTTNPSPFSSHVHIYHTIGIHPKYLTPQSMYKNLNDLSNHLETSLHIQIYKKELLLLESLV